MADSTTSNLLAEIKALEAKSAPLNPGETERQESLAQVNEVAQAFLNQASQIRTYSSQQVEKNLSIQDSPQSLKTLLDLYQTEVTGKGIERAAAGHLGYIPGGGIYASALADYLADVTNEYAGVHYASPGAVAIENAVLDWLKSIFGFPTSAVGNLASGGSIANLIALTAARDKHGVKNERITKSVVYLSEQVHHCIQKALRIIGLEDVIVREMPLDENFKLQPTLIARQIAEDKAAGLHPFLVIASAGTTDTGVVDPLQVLGELCQQEGL